MRAFGARLPAMTTRVEPPSVPNVITREGRGRNRKPCARILRFTIYDLRFTRMKQ